MILSFQKAAGAFLAAAGLLTGAPGQATTFQPLAPCTVKALEVKPLASTAECQHCEFNLLPGRAVFDASQTVYSIHSDLPEILLTPGVAYATTAVLPPFDTHGGVPVSEEMRTQLNKGFTTIDDNFELFLFHISQPGNGTEPRRLVVYVENRGPDSVTIRPRQVLISDGTIGRIHEMESTLGRRVLSNDWNRPIASVTIPAGAGEVVAYSKRFAAPQNGPDESANVNCFGMVRADIVERKASTNLVVYVVAIPGIPEIAKNAELAKGLLATGARSGETYLDLNTEPSGCQLRRTCGVFPTFQWRSYPAVLDVADVPAAGTRFQMALPAIQTGGCPEARQTVDLLLHQKTNRPDTVGNYMVEYRLDFRMVNQGKTQRTFDLRFGKSDADIGLGFQVATGKAPPTDADVLKQTVRTAWAGPKQDGDRADDTRTFLESAGGPITLKPCEDAFVSVRCMVLGNSSLPFQVGLFAEDVE